MCIDEKSQIQVLERSQPILPIIQNVPEQQSVDYLRHWTTTLFAALDVLSGNVIGECSEQHTAEDYISSWLNLVKRRFAEITNKRIRRGSFESVPQLIGTIKDYIKTWKKSGCLFTWTKTHEEILAKINKAKSF